MRRIIVVLLVACGVLVCLGGCAKKSEPLEEMQQPMSPEDLNRLKNQPVSAVDPTLPPQAVNSQSAAVATGAEKNLEYLPPEEPRQPTAKEIQIALKNAGFYQGAVDGKIGTKSKSAIKEFQKTNGLEPDGKVGPKTWEALNRYLNVAPSAGNTVPLGE